MNGELQQLVKFNVTDAAIAQMAERYMKLTINGLEDTEGFKAVHVARMDVKGRRIEVEKTRKSLKEEALRFGKLVDGEAKRITALIAPIEEHLQSEEDKIQAEKDRIKAEEIEKAKAESAERAIEAERLAKIEAEEEARRQEELKPDKEKLLALADMIRTVPIPTLKHKAAQNIAEAARANLLMASKHITEAVAKMKGGK
jgi:uncharacterized FlgJ-related protein